MAGIKYAPKPYDKSVTVLERVEYFRHWFYITHQKKGAVAIKLGINAVKSYWQWELNVKSLHNWVCQ